MLPSGVHHDAATHDDLMISPTVVGAVAVERQRSAEIGHREQSHVALHAKLAHRAPERVDISTDITQQHALSRQLTGVGIEASHLNEEHLPAVADLRLGLDDSRDFVQLLAQTPVLRGRRGKCGAQVARRTERVIDQNNF